MKIPDREVLAKWVECGLNTTKTAKALDSSNSIVDAAIKRLAKLVIGHFNLKVNSSRNFNYPRSPWYYTANSVRHERIGEFTALVEKYYSEIKNPIDPAAHDNRKIKDLTVEELLEIIRIRVR